MSLYIGNEKITPIITINSESIDDFLSTSSENPVQNKTITSKINEIEETLLTKQDVILDLSTIRSGATTGSTALQPNDNITELTNNAGYITGISSSDVTTALGFTPYDSSNPDGYTNNTGTITGITMNGESKGTSGVINLGTVITEHQDISGKQDKITSSNKLSTDLIDGLATVATSGSYNDLDNKPTIPTVNNATLTIQKNGTDVTTFTANSSTNATANITVPTTTNELTNDSGFITNEVSDLTNYRTASTQDTIDSGKQETLISGTNIKTINNESILGSGNIDISSNTLSITEYTVTSTDTYTNIKDKLKEYFTGLNRGFGIYQIKASVDFLSGFANGTTELVGTGQTRWNFFPIMNDSSGYWKCLVTISDDTKVYLVKQYLTTFAVNELVVDDNLKTINNQSLLGSGNLTIEAGEAYTALEIETLWENN